METNPKKIFKYFNICKIGFEKRKRFSLFAFLILGKELNKMPVVDLL